MFLGSEEIKRLIKTKKLVKDFINLEQQLQPNGFDLTVKKLEKLCGRGIISIYNKETPPLEEIPTNSNNMWFLPKGCYIITFNEVLKYPKGIAGIGIQRSSMIRCGVFVNVSSWDSGYDGRGQNLLVVSNDDGFYLQKNSRVVQIQFIKIIGKNFMYKGHYQGENI